MDLYQCSEMQLCTVHGFMEVEDLAPTIAISLPPSFSLCYK